MESTTKESPQNISPDMSPEIGKLGEALAKAQSEMEGVEKDGENPFFEKAYSTLHATWKACRKPLTKNGLSVIQTTGNGGDKITLYTMLIHSSGQWIRGALSIKPLKADPQALGSALTYLRRYGLSACVGLSSTDDDGEGGMDREKKKAPPKKTTQKKQTGTSPNQIKTAPMSEGQRKKIFAMITEYGMNKEEGKKFRDHAKGDSETTVAWATKFIDMFWTEFIGWIMSQEKMSTVAFSECLGHHGATTIEEVSNREEVAKDLLNYIHSQKEATA